jgi:hypothetical protein
MKKLTNTAILLVVAMMAIALGCQNGMTTMANTDLTAVDSSAAATAATATPADDAPRTTLADAKAAFDAGGAIFVDTRAETAYQAEHIKGAINITRDKLDANLDKLSKNRKIIAYCS